MRELDQCCKDRVLHREWKRDLFIKISCLYPQSKIRSRKSLIKRFISYMEFFDGLKRAQDSNIAVLLGHFDNEENFRSCRADVKHKVIKNLSKIKSTKSHRLSIKKRRERANKEFEKQHALTCLAMAIH